MASLRKAATKVVVFQWPCGARPIKRREHLQRPRSLVIAVFVLVSSMKTSLLGSSVGWPSRQA